MVLTIGTTTRIDSHTWFQILNAFDRHAMFIGTLSSPTKPDVVNILDEWRMNGSFSNNFAQRRTSTEKAVPNNPENKANIKYKVPISLAFVDKNQRSYHILIDDFKFVLFKWLCLSSRSWMICINNTLSNYKINTQNLKPFKIVKIQLLFTIFYIIILLLRSKLLY